MATYWENSCSFGLRYVSWYKYLIVSLIFSHLGFWSGNLFLIAPFPDLCLLFVLWSVQKALIVSLVDLYTQRPYSSKFQYLQIDLRRICPKQLYLIILNTMRGDAEIPRYLTVFR